LYKGFKLFLSEDGLEVVRVDRGIASIPSFRIDISLSSESIQFGAQIIRVKPDNKVELREVLRPPCLPPGQDLGSRKILKVFIICNNINVVTTTYPMINDSTINKSQVQISCGKFTRELDKESLLN